MKQKALGVFLGCEAVLCVLLYFGRAALPGIFTTVMAFPFEQLGLLLRVLSLSGAVGNVTAILLFCMISLVPAAFLPLLHKKRGLCPEDGLLALLSALLFAVLYCMINPGLMGSYLGSTAGQAVGKALLGGTVYSVLLGYGVLRVLRLFFAAGTAGLQKYLTALLCVLNVLFVYLAFGSCFGGLMDSLAALQAGNTAPGQKLWPSCVFLVLQFVVDALPYLLDVLVVFGALALLRQLAADRYSQATVAAAGRLARLCGVSLAVTVLAGAGFNLLQILFLKALAVVNGRVQLPVLSVAFVLVTLLLAQYIRENKQLKDDNDMFI